MRKYIYFLCLVLICLAFSGCTQKEKKKSDKYSYETFQNDYQHIADNFQLKGFKKTGDGESNNSCVVFPENSYFSEKKDMVDEDIMKPVKKNLFYINKKKQIMVYITHLYLKKSMGKNLITVDVPAEEFKAGSGIKLPYFQEYFFSYHNTLVSFKTMYVGDIQKKKVNLNDISDQAFQEYVKLLK